MNFLYDSDQDTRGSWETVLIILMPTVNTPEVSAALICNSFKFTAVPQIDCDIKAGKIINPEFIAKCPAGCQDTKYHVYGTDIYASFSSLCGAAIHSGVVDNSGGKILVRKVAGQSGYKGSYANGIRSLSLPRWRESFIIAEGKHKKGVTYPTTLEYSSSKGSTVKAGNSSKVLESGNDFLQQRDDERIQ
uniref:LCCL domain-containing protein n=1 Tax=Ornithorhynchus anatinus TaxID=9258 RepID=A0A6I8NHC1_ORNAN